jgi:hypothetical protein
VSSEDAAYFLVDLQLPQINVNNTIRIEYLGFIIIGEGVSIDLKKITTI